MVLLFFQNTALIVAFTCVFNLLYEYYKLKYINGRATKLYISVLASVLTFVMMLHPYSYDGMRFDLRSVPTFFISYFIGWKYSIITSIAPIIYRSYLGGKGTFNGILASFIFPIIIGSLIPYIFRIKNTSFQIINMKGLIFSNLVYSFIRAITFSVQLNLPLIDWIWLNINLTFFSVLALLCIGLMLNHSTRRLVVERKSKENEERYKQLITMLPDGLSILCDRKYVYANQQLAKILNVVNKEVLIGKETSAFYSTHPEYIHMVSERLKILSKEGKIPFFEQKIILMDGSIVDVEISSAVFYIEDKEYILSIIRDLSEQKRGELANKLLRETIEIDKLRTEFFSNMSHELKTPLNIILGTVQLTDLLNKDNPPYQSFYKHSKIMKQNCYRLLRLVNNFIDMTRLEAGYLVMNIYNFDIVKIVEDITQSVAKYIENRNVKITFDTEVEELFIACDPDKIERILLNLLANSIKFTRPEDEINVYISIDNNNVNISVKDTGIGIPKDKQHIIFERFRQVDASLQRKAEGSGIGLSLVKSLVEAHGGNIAVKSDEGKGCEFIVSLPVILVDNDESDYQGAVTTGETNIERIHIEFSDIYS